MAELKRNFLKAKMNKDLDERLIPEGEYRDALNVEITTSEGSNTGSAQTLKGNKKWDENYTDKGSTLSNSTNGLSAKTVGTYVDEENNKIYNFVCDSGNLDDEDVDGLQNVGVRSDLIEQITPHATNPSLTETKIVFHDVYEINVKPSSPSTDNKSIVAGVDRTRTLEDGFSIQHLLGGVRVGMKVQAIHPDTGDLYGVNNDIYVTSISQVGNAADGSPSFVINITEINGRNLAITQQEIDQDVVLKFTTPRILKFSKGSSKEQEQNTDDSISNTPSNSMITGINVIDDFLLWTDGRNEPKKINIKSCIKGTVQNQNKIENIPHTLLVVNYKNVNQKCGYIKETHITALKPNPLKAPKVLAKANDASYTSLSVPIVGTYSSAAPYTSFSFYYSGSYITNSTNLYIKFEADLIQQPVVGDILKFTGLTSGAVAYFNVVATPDSLAEQGVVGSYYTVNLRGALPDGYTDSIPSSEAFVVAFDITDNLYRDDFLRFAYRYKYADGEYSCISPYSNPAFVPGNYSYSAKDGFNLGMINYMQRIEIDEYIEPSIPEDVVEVELIFKSQKTDNFYAFKSVYRDLIISTVSNDIHEHSIYFSGNTITISDKISGYTIPTDQVLRTFDAVPIKAVAQELQSNRLMYGNYAQDYDLLDASGGFVSPNINSFSAALPLNFEYSWNSTNTLIAQQLPIDEQNFSPTLHQDNIRYFIPDITGELSDAGNNYANNIYTAPTTGFYKIKASVFTLTGNQQVQFTVNGNVQIETLPVNTQLAVLKIDSSGNPIITTFNNNFLLNYGTAPQSNIAQATGQQFETIDEPEIYLEAGEKIALVVIAKVYSANNAFISSSYNCAGARFEVTEAPSSTNGLNTLLGHPSVKSNRSYDLGIVYRDYLGRESTVIVSEEQRVTVPKSSSRFANRLVAQINHNAPYWADTYKFFIKENSSKFNNLVMEAAFLASDFDYAYLVFNQVDKNKVTTGDFLVLKKLHESNTPSVLDSSSWRVVSIIGESADGTVDGTTIPDSAAASVQEGEGKFFVKVRYNTEFSQRIGNLATAVDNSIVSPGNNNGAVFEVVKQNQEDLDIYHEIGDCYALRLDVKNAKNHIRIGSKVCVSIQGNYGELTLNENSNPIISEIEGAVSRGLAQQTFQYRDAFCILKLDFGEGGFGSNIPAQGLVLKITDYDGSWVSAKIAKNITEGDNEIWLHPQVHKIVQGDNASGLQIKLPWFNCYSFGNGVESDTIQDQFTSASGTDIQSGATTEQIAATELWNYTASGKQSGFKSNLASLDYQRTNMASDIIYSEVYSGKKSNRLNEFILSNSIVKKLNPDYGSIQKLFSRDTDILALCESKCLKILSEKDALFNADGSQQLLARKVVLGQAIPFSGEYGISKNPESFAFDEFRVYFTDKARGAVLRLSRDGLTAISNFGMRDWFSDKLLNSTALIGSFDSKKEEYNLTLHEVSSLNISKYVYTVSFNESSKGWTSFKSFVPEHGLTLNNQYFTFKNSYIYKHHEDSVRYNNFYAKQYNSTIDLIFNAQSSSVKDFKTINYEGTKAKDSSNSGWHTEHVNTDLQQSKTMGFVNKEGKWFSALNGIETIHVNIADGGTSKDTNIDFAELSVQGLSNLTYDATLYSGTLPSQGFNLIVNVSSQESQEA